MRDHPIIEKLERYGYPEKEKRAPVDYFGDTIEPGDPVVILDGDVISQDNLEKYLKEVWGAEFTLWGGDEDV